VEKNKYNLYSYTQMDNRFLFKQEA
jgi:hypothetical protein